MPARWSGTWWGRAACKSQHNRKDGYRAHLVNEPGTGLVTDEVLTMAAGPENSDAAIAARFVANTVPNPDQQDDEQQDDEQDTSGRGPSGADPATPGGGIGDAHITHTEDHQYVTEGVLTGGNGQTEGLTWYGDSAYGTGDLRAAIQDAGHDAVIKPKPVQPAVPGGFTLDDFTVDADSGTVTCPNGRTRPMSPNRTVTFGVLCRDCPLRARCTTAKTGRSLDLHEKRGARDPRGPRSGKPAPLTSSARQPPPTPRAPKRRHNSVSPTKQTQEPACSAAS